MRRAQRVVTGNPKEIVKVHKFLVGLIVTTTVALTALVVAAAPAYATIASPASGSTVSGTVTLSGTGTGVSGDVCEVAQDLGDDLDSTTVELESPAKAVVFSASSTPGSGTVGESASYETEQQPNGSYTVVDEESWHEDGGFLDLECESETTTYTESITIDNKSTTTYVGADSGAPGQTVEVAAQLGESGGNGIVPPAGQTVTFSLSGGGSVSATTNSSGVATAELLVTGAPRSATVSASYAGSYYAASSTTAAFTVTTDPTTTTVTTDPGGSATYGQPVTFAASVAGDPEGNGTPTGTVQFVLDGSPYGSPVALSGGTASIDGPSLGAGAYTVGADYSGDSNYCAGTATCGTSTAATLAVGPATTATSLSANPNPSVYGQPVTLTAAVSSGAGTPAGTVTFQEAGQPLGSPVTVGPGGQASTSIPAVDAGSYTFTAAFTGTDNAQGVPDYAASSASLDDVIGQASTATSLTTSAPDYAVYGQPVQFSAGVAAVPPGAGTPTGSVDFQYEGESPGSSSSGSVTDLDPVSLSGGYATSAAVASLNPGEYAVEAVYGGDTNFAGSSTSLTQYVFADPTVTTLNSSANPSVYGQPVSLTATVAAASPGAGSPTGEVDLQVQSTAPGSVATDLGSVTLSGGSATVALPTQPAGTYTVTATYYQSGDDFDTSSTTVTQVVDPDPTATTLSSSANPSVYGQPVSLTATVSATSPGSGTPTGTVTFTDGSTTLGTEPLASGSGGDQATLTTGALAVATHAITATYNGDPNFVSSDQSLTQTVNQAQTTTVVAQNGPSEPGQPVSFTATVAPVAPGAGTPTGTVTFELDGAPIGSPVALVAGTGASQATSTPISDLSPGTYAVTAVYSGDADFLTSTGSSGQPVGPAGTTTVLVASPDPATAGQPVTLTATVSVVAPGSGNPTGTVDFYDGPNLVGSALLSGGQAQVTTSTLPAGPDSLSASYVGDADFSASQSAAATEAIGLVATSTTLSTGPDPSSYGQSVSLTATVSAVAPGSGSPTGTVELYDGSTPIGSAPLSGGPGADQATLSLAGLPVGSDQLTAVYSGDGSHATSTSSPDIETVKAATTSLAADQLGAGGTVAATLTTASGPVADAPLTFTVGSTTICTATTASTGEASCTASDAQVLDIDLAGGYTVTYAGSTDYTAAEAP